MTPLILWVPGQPVPKGRPRFNGNKPYTDTKTRSAEEEIRWRLLEAKAKPFEGEVKIEMHFHRGDRRRADLDNLIKLCWDAMNGQCWRDDSQVVELHAYLERGATDPGTWLKVEGFGA